MKRQKSVCLGLEAFEARIVPANLTVTFAAGTLTVVGDPSNNTVTVTGDASDATHFTLTSTSDTFNNQPSPYSSPAGVTSLSFKMLAGSDSVTLSNTVPIHLKGNLSVDGGDGANFVAADGLTVDKNVSVTTGTRTTGQSADLYLDNSSVGGNVKVKNGDGATLTSIRGAAAGVSTVRGSVTVTNGTGVDYYIMHDMNVNGSVTLNNGHGVPNGLAGTFGINNQFKTAFRSVIGGNLTVTYLDGNVSGYDDLWDTEVMGNVTLNHGPGGFKTDIDAYATRLPVLIHGNLSILGTGANSVGIGADTNGYGKGIGLVVGKKFTLTSGGGAAATQTLFNLHVGGDTSLMLGDGGNTVTIDDSVFGGKFTLISGAGADTVNLETTAGTNSAVEFKKAVRVDVGSSSDVVYVAFNGSPSDAGQAVVFWGPAAVANSETFSESADHEFFPNSGHLVH